MGRACSRHGSEKCVPFEIGTREGKRLHGGVMRRRKFDMRFEELSVTGSGLDSSVSVQTPLLSVVKTASKWREISWVEWLNFWRTVLCSGLLIVTAFLISILSGAVTFLLITSSFFLDYWANDRRFLVVMNEGIQQTEATSPGRSSRPWSVVFTASLLCVKGNAWGPAVVPSDFSVTATLFRLLYCPRQWHFQSAFRKDKTVLYMFYGLPGCDVVWIGDGIDVSERSMLPEVEGSRFLRNNGTHLSYYSESRFRKPLYWYRDERAALYILYGYRQACVQLRSCAGCRKVERIGILVPPACKMHALKCILHTLPVLQHVSAHHTCHHQEVFVVIITLPNGRLYDTWPNSLAHTQLNFKMCSRTGWQVQEATNIIFVFKAQQILNCWAT